MPEQLKRHVLIPYAEFPRLSTDDMHMMAEWVKAHDPRTNHRGRIEVIEWDVDGDLVVVTVAPPTPGRDDLNPVGENPVHTLKVSPPAISPEAVAMFTIENAR